jgi:hypothetical protein
MTTYTYPSNDLERADFLISLLGSHWQHTYAGHDLVKQYVEARALEEQQSALNLTEAQQAMCRLEIRTHHTDNWYMLTLKESDQDSDPLRYGEGGVYGGPYSYGTPYDRPLYAFPLPEDLKAVTCLFNRITEPSLSWVSGLDFTIDTERQRIVFRENPFNNALVSSREIFEDGELTDHEAVLWLFRGQFDWEYARKHFGYVVSLYAPESSDHYTAAINAVFDALVEGSSKKPVELALSALTGIPLVVEDEETVELIQRDNHYLVIATDQHVYRFHLSDEPIVDVGDTVYAGQSLTAGLRFYELNHGEVPADLYALALDNGFISGYADNLTFRNESVPLIVEENVDGYTKVSFELGGQNTDVRAFWNDVHARGMAADTTLGHLLDIRGPAAVSEPTAASLPSTVNPLEFLVSNILRFHAFCVRINTGVVDTELLGKLLPSVLPKIVPPWTALIIWMEAPASDSISASSMSEAIGTYESGAHSADTVNGTTYLTETLTVRLIDTTCE